MWTTKLYIENKMSKINIGTSENKKINIDLDILLRTRLLIQANSGGGKSWLLRRIAEQAFGKVQIMIVDPEGEFPTLREKYDYVLVGKGGETPADVRSASLVAHKLLELNASAVCDLYEMKASQRHSWVKLFLEALIDAPKDLWHPVLVIVDEAHTFCPEKGAGESEASDAMIGLATRGRKRGFCAIFATQRLGKLRKDAAAELTNVLIGQTFIDVDRKRAAEALGIPRSDERYFFDEMKVVEPGNFWALGRAISKERILTQIGAVETTHPEIGSSKHFIEPPPPPAKIKSLLPKLSELPKEAEQKARTESDLRLEISSLKKQLSSRPTVSVPEVKVERVEVPVFQSADLERLENVAKSLGDQGAQLSTIARDLFSITKMKMSAPRPTYTKPVPVSSRPIVRTVVDVKVDGITGPEQRILDAIAWFSSIGQTEPRKSAIAFLSGYSYGGGAFNNPCGSLRSKGLITYLSSERMTLTEAGQSVANVPSQPLTLDEMQQYVFSILPGPEQRILKPLIDSYPNSVDKALLAELSGYKQGGAFNNPLGRLRTLGFIDYPEAGKAIALPFLFLEE